MTQLLRPFELDPFDLLWRNLLDTQSHFSAITQKITHPVDIFETQDGIRFEVAAVGINEDDISIIVEGDELRITYDRPAIESQETVVYIGARIRLSIGRTNCRTPTLRTINPIREPTDLPLVIQVV